MARILHKYHQAQLFMKVRTMEILDRNNIMQLALNLNFDNKSTASNASSAFIDMIKVPEFKSTSNNVETPVAQKQDTSKTVAKSDKKEVKNDNAAKQPSQDKRVKESSVKSKDKPSTKKVKASNSDDASTQNNTVVQENCNTNNENSDTAVAAANATPVDTQQVENETAAYDYDTALIDSIKEPTLNIVPLNIDLVADTEVLPEQTIQLSTNTDTMADLPQEQMPVADIEISQDVSLASDEMLSSVKTSQETVDLDFSAPDQVKQNLQAQTLATAEDELLIKQAQILDQKVISDKPLEIEVNTDAAKIAEPHHQEILQNSFEITSILQSAEKNFDTPATNDMLQVENENTVMLDSKQPVNLAKDDISTQAQINNVYAVSATETMAAAHLESEILSAQPQEIQAVNLQQHIIQSENSPKLQELNTDTSLKGLGKEVVEQIKINITKTAVKGVDTIDIELQPEELGKVQVRMYISKDGKLHTDIIASRQETADLLQREVDGLSKAFQDAGYDTDKQSFNFSFQKENQAGDQAREQKLQQFIGETLEQEAEDNLANDNMIYDPRRGLNIRV